MTSEAQADRPEEVTGERREGRMNSWIRRAARGPDPEYDTNNVADQRVEVIKRPSEIERTKQRPYG